MIAFIMIGTNDLESSTKFYDIVLNELNITKSFIGERYVGYSNKDNPKEIKIYITIPYNKEPAISGNGNMIALMAKTRDEVNRFHKVALENGAMNEGYPGQRPPDSDDYYAYIRDLSGNKICVQSKSI